MARGQPQKCTESDLITHIVTLGGDTLSVPGQSIIPGGVTMSQTIMERYQISGTDGGLVDKNEKKRREKTHFELILFNLCHQRFKQNQPDRGGTESQVVVGHRTILKMTTFKRIEPEKYHISQLVFHQTNESHGLNELVTTGEFHTK